jgi:hypothetical protein
MANIKDNNVRDPAKAEEIVKQELEREHAERYKASRLLGLGMGQGIGVGVALVVGVALLAYVLSMSYVLAAIIGAAGAIALTVVAVTIPGGRTDKNE